MGLVAKNPEKPSRQRGFAVGKTSGFFATRAVITGCPFCREPNLAATKWFITAVITAPLSQPEPSLPRTICHGEFHLDAVNFYQWGCELTIEI